VRSWSAPMSDAGYLRGRSTWCLVRRAKSRNISFRHPSVRKVCSPARCPSANTWPRGRPAHEHGNDGVGWPRRVLVLADSQVRRPRVRCAEQVPQRRPELYQSHAFPRRARCLRRFVDAFVTAAKPSRWAMASTAATNMGPLANARRITAMEKWWRIAVKKGAVLKLGGKRMGTRGYSSSRRSHRWPVEARP